MIEPENRQILTLFTSKERNMFVAERFIAGLVKEHKRHPISTDEGIWFSIGLSLSQTRSLSSFFFCQKKKILIESTMQYIKGRN